jgi:hypothetical protein
MKHARNAGQDTASCFRAPQPPMAGTAAIEAVVHLLATAIEEGRDLSSMSGILADTAYRLLLA